MPSPFIKHAKPLMTLALPIMGTQLAQTGLGVVDTLIAGMAGTLDLASIAVGSSIWLPLVMLVAGIMVGLLPLIAHAKGAKNKALSSQTLQQGIYLSLLLGIMAMVLLLYVTSPVMHLMGVTPEIQLMTQEYLNYIAYGLPAVAVHQALRSYNEAVNLTQPVTLIAFLGLLLNIPLNLIFVFGYGPIDALGGPGCGLASCIIFYLMAFVLAGYTLLSKHHSKVKPLKKLAPPNSRAMLSILAIGLPIGLAIFVEVSLFCAIALLIARLGPEVVAAHQITLSITSLLFMVPLSLALAITVRVGQELGQNNSLAAKLSWQNGLKIHLLFALINGSILVFLGQNLVGLYTQEAGVITLASQLLICAAIFQISDGLQVGAAGALRGYKDTLFTLVITLISFWLIGLPLGYYLGLSQQSPMGAQGFWIGLVVGLTINAVLLLIRLRSVSHKATQLQGI
ncbi:MAG: MATE family efflux transporter [Bermanella sp.]